ncbi:MAG: hypothetical protein J0G95_14135 [Rhizobiales bacterium]|nr:hypothetical protein [Hyphomicrobiales bacterium]
MTGLLIALAAGLASATMFASIVSGAAISLMLFYLAPLPLMTVGLGWGSSTAAIGGLVGALGVGGVFGLPYIAAFTVTVALPAWWLGHIALLARPVSSDPQLANLAPALDWYPIGRLLVWIAVFASITTVSAMLTLGTDAETIHAGLRNVLIRMGGISAEHLANESVNRTVNALAALAPGTATLIATATLTFNLWLAAKITATSQRLKRPWPDLRMTQLPTLALAALGAALLLCLAGGLIAILAQIFSAALLMAYGMTGFAVVHTLTQPLSGRAMMLVSMYAATMLIGWPLLGAILLGLADAAFGIRRRYWQRNNQLPPST